AALKQFLTYACTDKLASYKSTMTLLEFYQKYAPSADKNNPLGYATAVAKDLGISINDKIATIYAPEEKPKIEIHIENQLDAKWLKWYLGKVKTSGFKGFGCHLFCWTYIYSVKLGKQILPSEVDKIFIDHGVYSGDIIDSVKAAEALGVQYLGREYNITKAPNWYPTIKEVDFSIKNGKQQHFVIRELKDGKKIIKDPYGGVERAINFYELKVGAPNWETGNFSYRLVKI
ncbi:MAG: hypothetical protein PHD04_04300, partial [Candidatus Pacebacteria bacterium]|nr:hypothetical protein [Candidatus Paceibacterota bacterium]